MIRKIYENIILEMTDSVSKKVPKQTKSMNFDKKSNSDLSEQSSDEDSQRLEILKTKLRARIRSLKAKRLNRNVDSEELDNSSSEAEEEQKFSKCSASCHTIKICPLYPRDKVPIEFFKVKHKTGELYKQCEFCRDRRQKRKETSKKSKKPSWENKEQEPEIKDGNETTECTCQYHNTRSESPYPKNAVPIELFMGCTSRNSANGLFKFCLHCRKFKQKKYFEDKIKKNIENGQICPKCGKADTITGRKPKIEECPECVENFSENVVKKRKITLLCVPIFGTIHYRDVLFHEKKFPSTYLEKFLVTPTRCYL